MRVTQSVRLHTSSFIIIIIRYLSRTVVVLLQR